MGLTKRPPTSSAEPGCAEACEKGCQPAVSRADRFAWPKASADDRPCVSQSVWRTLRRMLETSMLVFTRGRHAVQPQRQNRCWHEGRVMNSRIAGQGTDPWMIARWTLGQSTLLSLYHAFHSSSQVAVNQHTAASEAPRQKKLPAGAGTAGSPNAREQLQPLAMQLALTDRCT